MVMFVAKWTADFMVSSRSLGSRGRAKRGIPCMATSELFGAGLKSVRGWGSRLSVVERCLARGEKYAWKAIAGVEGFEVREMVPFWLIEAVRARGRLQPMLLR
jgi:hypothetical protein